jgi:hypothetical protein
MVSLAVVAGLGGGLALLVYARRRRAAARKPVLACDYDEVCVGYVSCTGHRCAAGRRRTS